MGRGLEVYEVCSHSPPVRDSIGTGSPFCSKFAKGAPLGRVIHKCCGPKFSSPPPLCSNLCGAGGFRSYSQRVDSQLEAGGCTAPGDQMFSRGSPLFSTNDFFLDL